MATTTHRLAKQLLNKPDGFLTITLGKEEYIIDEDSIQRTRTHSNYDDSITHWTINLNGKKNR